MCNKNTVTLVVEIDCPPGSPRPDTYMKTICDDILKQEYHNPVSTFFGEWDWHFEILKSEAEAIQKKVMEYLVKLYNGGCIRYGGANV